MNPVISVLMPVLNGGKYIKQSIESVLSQSFNDFELLIIDDASTDDSIKIVNSIKDKRIQIHHNGKRLGLVQTRQRGVAEARGKFIAFMDCDDISLPDRFGDQLNFLDKNRQISLVGSWIKVIDENGKIVGKTWKHASYSEIIPSILLFRNCFTQSSVLIKRECLNSYPFRREFWAAPDYDLWNRLGRIYKLANLAKVLVYYRSYSNNMSSEVKQEIIECSSKIQKENLLTIGINPTKEELIIHDFLEREQLDVTDVILDKVYLWLSKLIVANEKTAKFDKYFFAKVVENYWFKVCCMGANKGLSIWKRYSETSLSSLIRTKKLKNFLLFADCLFKKRKIIDVTSNDWINITVFRS